MLPRAPLAFTAVAFHLGTVEAAELPEAQCATYQTPFQAHVLIHGTDPGLGAGPGQCPVRLVHL